MLRLLINFFRRPTVRMGRVDNARIHRVSAVKSAQFVSFMSESNCLPRRNPDRHDLRLRRLKLAKSLLMTAFAAGLAWVAIESARAIALF